jgi:hypothetical protein
MSVRGIRGFLMRRNRFEFVIYNGVDHYFLSDYEVTRSMYNYLEVYLSDIPAEMSKYGGIVFWNSDPDKIKVYLRRKDTSKPLNSWWFNLKAKFYKFLGKLGY